jgi:hypothetical protein
MPVRQLIVLGLVVLAAACGGSQSTQNPPPADTSQAVQLGGPPTGAGTFSADAGEINPVDPATFNKTPGYSPYAGRNYP